jgi:hypothetical protein
MASGCGEGCVCMMVLCALLTSQGGYDRHIHSDSRRLYRCLALTSTVIVAIETPETLPPWMARLIPHGGADATPFQVAPAAHHLPGAGLIPGTGGQPPSAS